MPYNVYTVYSVIVSHNPGLPLSVSASQCIVEVHAFPPVIILFPVSSAPWHVGGSSQSTNGSSWQNSRPQSASLAWPRSVCSRLRIMGDYCCWPPPRATPTWWKNWPRGRKGMRRPTWPFSPISCREGGWKRRGGGGKRATVCLNPYFS